MDALAKSFGDSYTSLNSERMLKVSHHGRNLNANSLEVCWTQEHDCFIDKAVSLAFAKLDSNRVGKITVEELGMGDLNN